MRLVRDLSADRPEIVELRRRLDEFYQKTSDYTAFQETVDRSSFYDQALSLIDAPADRSVTPLRVLELGAGRTGLPAYIRGRATGRSIHVTAQDVTPANLDYLRSQCDDVHIGDISQLPADDFDLVLHSYVFEHVSAPREFLGHVRRILRPGGWHAILCPRYDAPGYLCPSLRHLRGVERWSTQASLLSGRLAARFGKDEQFLVNTDPSLFHGPWYRDADAVHLVSRRDVENWHRRNGFSEVRRLDVGSPGDGIKARILIRLLTTAVAARKANA